MEFVDGKTEEERVLGGLVFPKTLKPPPKEDWGLGKTKSGNSNEESLLVEMIREKREWVSEVLERHSAILFRGFGVSSPEEFGRVVDAFQWEEMSYVGPVSRSKVADRVYTANDGPLHRFISFHHEMSTVKEFPSKIFFYCEQPSPKGGETSILPGYVVLEKMEEQVSDFVSELLRLGYSFLVKTAKPNETNPVVSKTWQRLLNTEDKVEAEKRAKEILGCSSVKFNAEGSADFVYGPLNPVKEFGGRRVWLHHLVGRNEGDVGNYFGDGTPLPRTALETYRKIMLENCVDIKWQKGDVLLLDNNCVQHARRPGEPPRTILVSMCK